MLKRLRQFLTLVSLCLLVGVLTLWARDDALIIRSKLHADARSYVLVSHGALNVDYTGLYYLLRDARFAWEISVARESFGRLPAELQTAADIAGPWTFRWQSRFITRTPLQDLTDSAGQPIYVEQSVPMKLITVPVWLMAGLLAIAPGRAFARRIRGPRSGWLAPLRFARRRGVAICTLASIGVCLAWIVSMYRPATFFDSSTTPYAAADRGGSAAGALSWRINPPIENYYRNDFVGNLGVTFQRDRSPRQHLIAPIEAGHMQAERYQDEPVGVAQVPYWLLFIATAFVPMTWLAMRIWGRRLIAGHCSNCDYDLRYSSERCPECGQPIVATPPKVGRRRAQAARFALAAILLLAAATVTVAWAETTPNNSTLLFAGNHYAQGYWFSINETGRLEGFSGTMYSKNGPLRPFLSTPTWVPISLLLAASGGLFWMGRRAGQVISPVQ